MAEQIREKRRIERKQFKIDRAAAMLDAAKTAEAVLVSGLTAATPTAVASSSGGGSPATGLQRQLSGLEGEGEADRDAFADGYGENETATSTPIPVEEDGAVSSIPPSPAPSASSNAVLDYTSLTPQTFLVRPTRPDANRNRGRKAFKRRPPPQKPQSQPQPGSQPSQPPSTMNPDVAGPAVPSVDTAGPGTASSSSLPSAGPSAGRSDATGIDVTIPPTMSQEPHNENDEEEDEVLARGEEIEEMVEEMEHLQLGAEEAWFLAAGLGVLKVYDPATDSYPPLPALLPLFLTPLEPPSPTTLALMPTPPPMYPDDPFLVSYVAYHHYRSLGWVVKPGIKFCCDWLLYRRGPAFSHSAFSLLLIPVPAASSPSPHALSDYYADRLSWKWINTVMRVNSLVQKTVILVYVTIPSIKDFPASARTTEGALDFGRIGIRGLLERYAINEVSLTRFGPARRRD
ncbi:tRNA splicing endonuclease subunit sen2 [Saitozyma podzolica]|uniref:tRNA-intron lyase n=1 Tax=Saitozyma podzolica TaxID=1890683 RepID=A0A427YNW5_9TREE|nr:tRNA splicing endonuclease subunit sen2 [Saitozyma podzolica]